MNIFLLGTCRIRNIYDKKINGKYNLINYNNDFIGRTYSLKDTYELLYHLISNKKNIYSHEFRNNQYEFYENIKNINLNDIDIFVIEISSIKYYTHSYKNMESNIVFSPNFGKNKSLNKFNLHLLSEKEMDYYFNKIIELISDKKILFVSHLKSNIIPNRILIKENLIKNITNCNKNNIFLITPEELLNTSNIDEYLSDDNHYKSDYTSLISNRFFDLFDKI